MLWGLPDETRYVEQYESLGKPALSLGDEHVVVVGRVMLPRAPESDMDGGGGGGGGGGPAGGAAKKSSRGEEGGGKSATGEPTFASTGHVMRMMERVAAAIGQARQSLAIISCYQAVFP